MATCPVCTAQIEDDFGLVTCPQCGSQVLVDMDGAVGGPGAASGDSSSSNVEQNATPSDDVQGFSDELSKVLVSEISSEVELPPLPEEVVMASAPKPDEVFEQPPPLEPVMASEEQVVGMESIPPVMESFANDPVLEEPSPVAAPATPNMNELADYGNSEASEAQTGHLRFNVVISGIDTADIRNDVLSALRDQRFLWDVDALAKSIRNGELHLKELTAVKSAIVIQRLRAVPVEIRWDQYAITQA